MAALAAILGLVMLFFAILAAEFAVHARGTIANRVFTFIGLLRHGNPLEFRIRLDHRLKLKTASIKLLRPDIRQTSPKPYAKRT